MTMDFSTPPMRIEVFFWMLTSTLDIQLEAALPLELQCVISYSTDLRLAAEERQPELAAKRAEVVHGRRRWLSRLSFAVSSFFFRLTQPCQAVRGCPCPSAPPLRRHGGHFHRRSDGARTKKKARLRLLPAASCLKKIRLSRRTGRTRSINGSKAKANGSQSQQKVVPTG
jgi:hypothetical protein